MKKVALSLLALALVGSMAFGQDAPAAPAAVVTIGDWGRQIFAVGNQDSSGLWSGVGTSWGSSPRIVGLNIQAHTDTAGFSITPSADNGTFGLTDQNKAWINPLPGLTFESGINLETDTWRGTGDFGSYDWIRFPGEHGDSVTFFRLGEPGAPSLETDLNYNKDGVGGWVLIQQNGGGANTDFGSNLQAGGAFTIAGVGQIKAQYIGYNVNGTGVLTGNNAYGSSSVIQNTAGASTFGIVQAAFNLQSVENLYEEVSVIVPSSASAAGYVFEVADVAKYKIDKTTLHGLIVLASYNGTNNTTYTSSGLGLEGHVGADYDLGAGVGFDADLLYVNALQLDQGVSPTSASATYPNAAETGFSAGLVKSFSNGSIGIGFEYSTQAWNGGNTTGTSYSNSHWAIPIKAEEWF